MGEYARLSNDDSMGCGCCSDDSYKAFDWSNRPAELNVIEVKKETDKSWFITVMQKNKNTVDVWFPKSKCKIKDGVILVPKWLLSIKNKEILTTPKNNTNG